MLKGYFTNPYKQSSAGMVNFIQITENVNKVVYNVTIHLDQSIEDDWCEWMINKHIPDVMSTGMFEKYQIQRVIGSENESGITYAVQYVAENMSTLQQYHAHHAAKLQKDHSERYEGKFAAFRTIMEILDHN